MTAIKLNKYEKLFKCYYPGLTPPEWSLIPNESLMKLCKVFYNEDDNKNDIIRLVKEREPVNMSMDRMYDKTLLYSYFNYKTGYYGSCKPSKNSITPPNFILYTPTNVKLPDGTVYSNIHILNAIGLAFDSEEQPDYKTYIKLSTHIPKPLDITIGDIQIIGDNSIQIKHCEIFYKRLFNLILKTARKLNKTNIVMSLVGANNFAMFWKGGPNNFKKTIWIPIFNEVVKLYPDLNIMFMGSRGNPSLKYKNLGLFPTILEHPDIKYKLDDTLLINAWDCWSVPGNGNEYDNSLDGYIGRCTQIGINGTSITNKYLTYVENYIIP